MYYPVRTAILATLLSLSAAIVHSEPILNHLPDDAIGFILIRNLAATNAKIESVTKIFQDVSPMPIPAPLPVLKAATGLGEGLNEQGDALLALLPGEEGVAAPRPLLLVAVSDYATFAASIDGDATGEVCRVTIAEEEILVAKRGEHAVLMNVEHRERLESLLATEPKPLSTLEPMNEWLAKTDVAAVLTPSGVDMLTAMGQQGLAGQRAAIEQRSNEPELAETFKQLQGSFKMYEDLLGFLGAELEVVAAGLAIDDQANLKLLSQSILSNQGSSKSVAASSAGVASPLAGFPDEPYVVAAGGPLPKDYGGAAIMRRMIEANPQTHGFEDLTEQDWQELEESWKAAMKGVTSMSMLIQPGDQDDPLMSNVYSVIHLDDAQGYLDSYKKSMEKWNALLAKTSSDIKLAYETSDVEVGGKQGLLTTTDVGAAANDGNDPTFNAMMEGMFGKDGIMRTYFIPADDTTVVMGMSQEEDVAAMLETTAGGETGLADLSATQTTLKLLDPGAPWQGIVSPQGTVAWITRFYDKFLSQIGPAVRPTIPIYPDSSPVGFSVNLIEGRLSTEMAWPVDTLQGVAAYIKKLQDSF